MLLTNASLSRALQVVKSNGGFMNETDIDIIAHHDRLRMVLVRCGNGRFLCPIQDVKHFMAIVQRDGQDHVRDVSLPSTDSIWR